MTGLISAVNAAGGAGFLDDDFGQGGERRLESSPDPASEIFAGRIFQTFDLVEKMMVQLLIDRLENLLELGKIHHPAGRLTQRSCDVDLNSK